MQGKHHHPPTISSAILFCILFFFSTACKILFNNLVLPKMKVGWVDKMKRNQGSEKEINVCHSSLGYVLVTTNRAMSKLMI